MSKKVKTAINIGNVVDAESINAYAQAFNSVLSQLSLNGLEQQKQLEIMEVFAKSAEVKGASVNNCQFQV